MGYSFQLAERVLLYASFHRQDNTYHSLCYTSRGALAGTRNSSMGLSSVKTIKIIRLLQLVKECDIQRFTFSCVKLHVRLMIELPYSPTRILSTVCDVFLIGFHSFDFVELTFINVASHILIIDLGYLMYTSCGIFV